MQLCVYNEFDADIILVCFQVFLGKKLEIALKIILKYFFNNGMATLLNVGSETLSVNYSD